MTEHLPECPTNIGLIEVLIDSKPAAVVQYCGCSMLRAYEERVRGTGLKALLIAEGVSGVSEYGEAKWARGRADALDAALEAIRSLPDLWQTSWPGTIRRDDAAAAINALRKDSDD